MITAVEIDNFKGIGSRQRVEFRPITLLFGPNSAGKSTILNAIHYAAEVLDRRNLDADRTLAGGPFVDLGGFRNFVHGHDLSRPVVLRFEIDVSGPNTFMPELGEWNDESTQETQVLSAIDEIKSASVEVTIRWNATREWRPGPYVSSYAVEVDGHPVARLTATPEPNSVRLADLNVRHPIFVGREAEEPLTGLFDEVHFVSEPDLSDSQVLILFEQWDALPEWGKVLPLNLTMDIQAESEPGSATYKKQYWYETEMRILILSRLMVGPGQLLRDELAALRYIGPLRQTPGAVSSHH